LSYGLFCLSFLCAYQGVLPYLQLLWQFGDRYYHAKKWHVAVDWFLRGTHQLFRNLAQGRMKCFRKAALCYVQLKEYASASALIRQCPGNEAATHYVALLTAVKQGMQKASFIRHNTF
jgi:hypothetical protein